jgi:phage anti-repressor protein
VTLDIVNLIEKNPIARFNRDYQNKFIQKIQQKFIDTEQHLFVASFYCFLNYNKNDFVIDMENVWKWLGFARKDFCKRVLDKHFIKGKDYIIALLQAAKPKNEGGHNKETILLNIITFKKLCLKSNTKKADEIHDYFIKLEKILQEKLKYSDKISSDIDELLKQKAEDQNDETKPIFTSNKIDGTYSYSITKNMQSSPYVLNSNRTATHGNQWIINTLENKNSSKKISILEIHQKEFNLNKIFRFLNLSIKKIDSNFRSRNSTSECRKQEKIN